MGMVWCPPSSYPWPAKLLHRRQSPPKGPMQPNIYTTVTLVLSISPPAPDTLRRRVDTAPPPASVSVSPSPFQASSSTFSSPHKAPHLATCISIRAYAERPLHTVLCSKERTPAAQIQQETAEQAKGTGRGLWRCGSNPLEPAPASSV